MTDDELYAWLFNSGNFCGCENPEDAATFLRDILRLAPLYESRSALEELLPRPGLRSFVLYQVDSMGLLEHGGVISGSWLTDLGVDVLRALEAVSDFEAWFDHRQGLGIA